MIFSRTSKAKRAFLALLVICILARAGMWLIYQPIAYPDTGSYMTLARQMQSLDFSGYDGARPPAYPLLLFVSGLNFEIIWFIQTLLGIAISLMLFMITLRQTGNRILAFLVGVTQSLSLPQLSSEATILTETYASFLTVLSMLVFMRLSYSDKHTFIYCLLLGIVASLAALTRPLLLTLIPVYLIAVVRRLDAGAPISERVKQSLTYLAPIVFIVGGWSLFNGMTVGYFGPTTLVGYNLTQHSGGFIEFAPDKYAELRDVYIEFRQKRMAETGSHSMTIWQADQEMRRRTGLSVSELSKRLTEMSLTLFVQHPMLYFRSVALSWTSFWTPRLHWWRLDNIRFPSLAAVLMVAWLAEWVSLTALHVLFLFIAAHYLFRLLARREVPSSQFNWPVIAVVLLASVAQALVEFGENARYAIPFQPLILYTVFTFGWHYLTSVRGQRATRVEP